MKDLIILNSVIYYDNFDEVKQYVEHSYSLPYTDNLYFAIVVNKIKEEDVARLNSLYEGSNKVFVFYPNKNLGYMNGLIEGYEAFVNKTSIEPDYVIMSNTDIIYRDELFFKRFIENKYDDDIWVIGPSVYANNRKSFDNPVLDNRPSKRNVKKLIFFTSTPIIRSLYVGLSDYKARLVKREEEESRFIYQVHGCYFIVKNELAKQMVAHKFGVLLYSEEAYVSEEALKSNKKVYYDKTLKIIHDEHSVTGKLKTKKIAKYISESMRYILKEYYE